MDYNFEAKDLKQENYIIIDLPDDVSVCINRCDVGYAVDFRNKKQDIIIEAGTVWDDDLGLNEDE